MHSQRLKANQYMGRPDRHLDAGLYVKQVGVRTQPGTTSAVRKGVTFAKAWSRVPLYHHALRNNNS